MGTTDAVQEAFAIAKARRGALVLKDSPLLANRVASVTSELSDEALVQWGFVAATCQAERPVAEELYAEVLRRLPAMRVEDQAELALSLANVHERLPGAVPAASLASLARRLLSEVPALRAANVLVRAATAAGRSHSVVFVAAW